MSQDSLSRSFSQTENPSDIFDEKDCRRKLRKVTKSADDIRNTAAWLVHHREKVQIIAKTWISEFKKAAPSIRLVLFYVLHEFLVQCRKRRFEKSFPTFQGVLREAMVYSREKDCKKGVSKTLKIFKEASFFPETFIKQLSEDLRRGKSTANYNKNVLADFEPLVFKKINAQMTEFASGTLAPAETQFEEKRNFAECGDSVISQIKDHASGKERLASFDDGFEAVRQYSDALEQNLQQEYDLLNQLELLRIHHSITDHEAKRVIIAYGNYEVVASMGSRRLAKLRDEIGDRDECDMELSDDDSGKGAPKETESEPLVPSIPLPLPPPPIAKPPPGGVDFTSLFSSLSSQAFPNPPPIPSASPSAVQNSPKPEPAIKPQFTAYPPPPPVPPEPPVFAFNQSSNQPHQYQYQQPPAQQQHPSHGPPSQWAYPPPTGEPQQHAYAHTASSPPVTGHNHHQGVYGQGNVSHGQQDQHYNYADPARGYNHGEVGHNQQPQAGHWEQSRNGSYENRNQNPNNFAPRTPNSGHRMERPPRHPVSPGGRPRFDSPRCPPERHGAPRWRPPRNQSPRGEHHGRPHDDSRSSNRRPSRFQSLDHKQPIPQTPPVSFGSPAAHSGGSHDSGIAFHHNGSHHGHQPHSGERFGAPQQHPQPIQSITALQPHRPSFHKRPSGFDEDEFSEMFDNVPLPPTVPGARAPFSPPPMSFPPPQPPRFAPPHATGANSIPVVAPIRPAAFAPQSDSGGGMSLAEKLRKMAEGR